MDEAGSRTTAMQRVLPPLPAAGGPRGAPRLAPSVRSALRALGAYKLRSILTVLPIILGVAALLGMVEVSQVSQEYVAAQWAHIGANLISVDYRPAPGASKAVALTQSTLTLGDVQALQRLPRVTAVSPVGYDGLPVIAGPITSGGWPIEAGFASLQMLQELSMQHGAFFTDQDEASGASGIGIL